MQKLPIFVEKNKTERQRYEEDQRSKSALLGLEELDGFATVAGKIRLERTLELLFKEIDVSGQRIADLGCGVPHILESLGSAGADITAVDINEKVVKQLTEQKIAHFDKCIPYLPFQDKAFDGLIFTDVIAHIDPKLYRLTFSELARILKRDGWLICSTPLDLDSYDAKEQFIQLVRSEFECISFRKSYHRLYLLISRLIKESSPFWNKKLNLALEKASKILFGDGAMSHLIVLARKKGM